MARKIPNSATTVQISHGRLFVSYTLFDALHQFNGTTAGQGLLVFAGVSVVSTVQSCSKLRRFSYSGLFAVIFACAAFLSEGFDIPVSFVSDSGERPGGFKDFITLVSWWLSGSLRQGSDEQPA